MPLESSRFRLDCADVAEYASCLSGAWALEYEQLEKGRASLCIEGVAIGSDVVYTERSARTLGIRGCVDPGTLLISLPSNRARHGRFWGGVLGDDSIGVVTADREIDVTLPDWDSVEVVVNEEEFRGRYRQAAGMDPNFLDGSSPILRLAPGEAGRIERMLRRLASGRTEIPPTFLICRAVAQAIAQAVHPRAPVADFSSGLSEKVRECIALWEHSDCSIGISEICEKTGVSERTIGNWFRAQFGLSPYQYLLRNRLNRAHSELLKADSEGVSVTEIAMRFGFFELGRFAGVYREFFGELPSWTLSQRPGRKSNSAQAIELPKLARW